MSRAARVDYMVNRASREETLEPPSADTTALLAHVLSRLGRALHNVDHLFNDEARRVHAARATFEEQMAILAAELVREAVIVDERLPQGQRSFVNEDVWGLVTRRALEEQFQESSVGPIIDEALRRFTWFATHRTAEMTAATPAFRDELVAFAAQLIDAATRLPLPRGQ